MNDDKTEWLQTWLETQRRWLELWDTQLKAADPAAGRQGVDASRESVAPDVAPMLNMFQEFMQSAFSGGAQWMRGLDEFSAEQASPNFWQSMLHAFPLGHMREHQTAWQELARASAEYRIQAQSLNDAFARVLKASLEAVPEAAERLAQQGKPVGGYRELYDVWIAAGEREFAKLAHDQGFAQLQAQFANAQVKLRRCQQSIIEQGLKQMDLPTRAELNSVHQRVRDLTARLEALEQRSAVATPTTGNPITPFPKRKSRGKAAGHDS